MSIEEWSPRRPSRSTTAGEVDRLLFAALGPTSLAPEPAANTALTWVGVGEAARASGASTSAIRVWYRSGQVPSKLVPGPHGEQRLVPLEAVRERARQAGKEPDVSAEVDESAVVELAKLAVEQAGQRELAAMDRADRAEARAQELEQQLRELIARAAGAEATLAATVQTADRHRGGSD
jgi:hypothetical protein